MDRTVDAANLGNHRRVGRRPVPRSALFLEADIVVKLVMLLLLVASIWVWAIVFEKVTALRRVNRQAAAFEDRFWSGGSLEDLYDQEGARAPPTRWPPCSAPRWANGAGPRASPAPTWPAAACATASSAR